MCRNLFRTIFAGESDVEKVSVFSDGAEGRADVGLEVVPPQAELVRRSHDKGMRKKHTTLHEYTHLVLTNLRFIGNRKDYGTTRFRS